MAGPARCRAATCQCHSSTSPRLGYSSSISHHTYSTSLPSAPYKPRNLTLVYNLQVIYSFFSSLISVLLMWATTKSSPAITTPFPQVCFLSIHFNFSDLIILFLAFSFYPAVIMPPKMDWTQARMQGNAEVKAELDKALQNKTVNHRGNMDVLTSAPWRTGAIPSIHDLATWVTDPASRHEEKQGPVASDVSSELTIHRPLHYPVNWTVRV